MYSTFKSHDKWERYYNSAKSAPNHGSLTLRIDNTGALKSDLSFYATKKGMAGVKIRIFEVREFIHVILK